MGRAWCLAALSPTALPLGAPAPPADEAPEHPERAGSRSAAVAGAGRDPSGARSPQPLLLTAAA
jgi:hypothetical protein